MPHGADACEEVESLAHAHVQAAEAAPDGGSQRALDGDFVLANETLDQRHILNVCVNTQQEIECAVRGGHLGDVRRAAVVSRRIKRSIAPKARA